MNQGNELHRRRNGLHKDFPGIYVKFVSHDKRRAPES